MVCYLSGWSKYRPNDGEFRVDKIDPFLCTHIVYTFAGLDINGNIVSLDPDNDVRDSKYPKQCHNNAKTSPVINVKTF